MVSIIRIVEFWIWGNLFWEKITDIINSLRDRSKLDFVETFYFLPQGIKKQFIYNY